MRLLAYGGIKYIERRRIGEWAEIKRGALEDTYGMPDNAIVYGCGILSNKPFLIYRQRQITDTGRSYAYTLLLDPGEENWKRFGWNAADFLAALIPSREFNALLVTPEDFYTNKLTDFLDALQSLNSPQKTDLDSNEKAGDFSHGDFASLWLGAAINSAPVTLAPSNLGFTARPAPSELAMRLGKFPPAFVNGAGFLVGGSAENGRDFGARLVIEDNSPLEPSAAEELLNNGKEFKRSWLVLQKLPAFNEIYQDLSQKALWNWNDSATEFAPDAIAERMLLLSQMVSPKTVLTPEIINQISSFNEKSDSAFLAFQLHTALQNRLLDERRQLSRLETDYLLKTHEHFNFQISSHNVDLFDKSAMLEYFERRSLAPDSPNAPPCSPQLRIDLWRDKLRRVDDKDLPNIFARVVADSPNLGKDFAVSGLLKVIGERISKPDSNLRWWVGQPDTPEIYQKLRGLLREEAFARAKGRTENDDWQLDYLEFAADTGGTKLLDECALKDWEFDELIEQFLLLCDGNETRVSGMARNWLNAAAETDARLYIQISQKIRIYEQLEKDRRAGRLVTNRWEQFGRILSLFNSTKETEQLLMPKTTLTVEDKQRGLLLEELKILAKKNYSSLKAFPNLAGLCEYLGKPFTDIGTAFENSQIAPIGYGGAANWVTGWRMIEPFRAAQETANYLLKSEVPAASDWLFPHFDATALEHIFRTLLFEKNQAKNDFYRRRLIELLSSTMSRKPVQIAVRAVCHASFNANRDVFARRFVWHEQSLSLFLACLPLKNTKECPSRNTMLAELADFDEKGFFQEAARVVRNCLENENANAYNQTICAYLQQKHCQNERLKIKQQLRYEGVEVSAFDDVVQRVAKMEINPVGEDQTLTTEIGKPETSATEIPMPENERGKSSSGNIFRTIFSIFGKAESRSDEPPNLNRRKRQ